MINLLPIEKEEHLKARINTPSDLDVLFFLFPHSQITVYAEGNNEYMVIIKEDTTNQL